MCVGGGGGGGGREKGGGGSRNIRKQGGVFVCVCVEGGAQRGWGEGAEISGNRAGCVGGGGGAERDQETGRGVCVCGGGGAERERAEILGNKAGCVWGGGGGGREEQRERERGGGEGGSLFSMQNELQPSTATVRFSNNYQYVNKIKARLIHFPKSQTSIGVLSLPPRPLSFKEGSHRLCFQHL